MVQTVPAPAAPSLRTRARKREILEAASRCFRRRGLHATGMRDIAGELGMAVGNLYYYFEDKHELLAFCQEDALAGLRANADRARSLDEPPETRLFVLLAGHLLCLHEGTPGSLAHLEVEALQGSWREQILGERDEYEAILRELLTAGVEAGSFRPVDPALAAKALLGALNWTVKWYDPQGAQSPRDFAFDLAELLVAGLVLSGRSTRPSPDLVAELSTEGDAHVG